MIVTEFYGGVCPQDVTVAADGTVYFTDYAAHAVGRITASGEVTIFRLPSVGLRAFGLTAGPGGRLYVTESGDHSDPCVDQRVASLARTGSSYDYVSVHDFGSPGTITTVDACVYFTLPSGLGRLPPMTKQADFYPFPTMSPWLPLSPAGITGDASGGVWVGLVHGASGYLGRFTPASESWDLLVDLPGSLPHALAVDATHCVWFTDFHHSQLGRLTKDGNLEVRDWFGRPSGITATPAGALWITAFDGNCLLEVDTGTYESVRTVPLPNGRSEPGSVTADATGRLWFAEQVGRIGCLSHDPPAKASAPHRVVEVARPRGRLRDVRVKAHANDALGSDLSPIRVICSLTHSSFLAPPLDLVMWRYVDMARLVAMLDTKALFFARLDAQQDRFEGSLPRLGLDDDVSEILSAGLPRDQLRKHLAIHRRSLEYFRPRALVSCWHASERESMAMWGLYAQAGGGIAIQSTVRRLVESINCGFVDENQTLGLEGGPTTPAISGSCVTSITTRLWLCPQPHSTI